MVLTAEGLQAIGKLFAEAIDRKFPELSDGEVLTAAEIAPIVNYRDGLFQTRASLEEFGADEWLMCNLQLSGNFPEKLSEVEKARVYHNTYCNADGSLAGSTTPPLQFPPADTPAEAAQYARCNGTNFVFDVEAARGTPPFGQFKQNRRVPLGRALGITGDGKTPPIAALRAQSWADVEDWCRRVGAERRRIGLG